MSRVVLARPAYSTVYGIYDKVPKDREVRVPLGLLYLASALENEGHEVKVIDGEPDLMSPTEIVKQVIEFEPDFVGISATTPEFHLAVEIVHWIKRLRPKIITIMGGAHVSALPQESAEDCPEIDYIVVAEGERSIVNIVNGQESNRIVISPLVANLDDLIPPARHLIDYDKYRYAIPNKGLVRMDTVEATRGCPYQCTYCYKMYKTVRFRNPIKVIDEIEESHRKYNTQLFLFYDDTWSARRDRAELMCDEIIRRGLDVKLYCFTRVDGLTKELIAKMRVAGFDKVTTGIESGNQAILDVMNKRTNLCQYEQAYKWLNEAGIETRGSFMVGCPYETRETVRDSIEFAKKLPLFRIGVNILTPYPGSPLYTNLMAKKDVGFRLLCKDWADYRRWGNSVVETDALTKSEIEESQKRFLMEFNSSWKVVRYHLKQLLRLNLSYFYYRPILYAVKERLKYMFTGVFRK